MRHALFLVKNGIGFGHIRRAMLVAEVVSARGELDPVIISQASSLALYRHTPVKVVNFPLLHRVASAVAEDCYTSILDRLIDRLDPAVVVEDTYPDPRYASLPALAGRPRLLLMRRLDGQSFDTLREQGRFAPYDAILIAQDREAFDREGHSPESVAAVLNSGRFRFVGNIAHTPTETDIEAVRCQYAPHGEPLVVVNGGAGGDQMPDGYGDRLFGACQQVAAQLADEACRARFIFVTGPYYAGRPLTDTANVTVRAFEPSLAALLAAARVAVIKPGNNVLSEALVGTAHLVLVPDVSFMEGVGEHAARVVAEHGGVVVTPDPALIESAVRTGLASKPRPTRAQPNQAGLATVVETIHQLAQDGPPAVAPHGLFLHLELPAGAEHDPTELVPPGLRPAVTTGPELLVIGGTPPDHLPQTLADRGVRIILCRGSGASTARRWLQLHPAYPALMVVGATVVPARRVTPRRLAAHLSRAIGRGAAPAAVILDLGGLDAPSVAEYLSDINDWLSAQPVALLTPNDVATWHARALLETQ
jgi:predicted glycosyltransferase